MKKLHCQFISLLILLFMSVPVFTQATRQEADQIMGIYWSPKKDAKIEIYKRGEQYFGKSVWIAAPRKDDKNPNENLRTREVLGIELLSHFSYDDESYNSGKIYDPESGKSYDCIISWKGSNLKVRGYIGLSLFGRTEIFERVK